MQVEILSSLPKEWSNKKPIESYETTFLATGFSRYNTTKKTLSQFVRKEDGIWYTESACKATVFPRVYAAELAHVTVYSQSPRVWSEDQQFFVESKARSR